MPEFTFLTEEQIWGDDALDVMKRYGTKVAPTDLTVILGCYMTDGDDCTSEGDLTCGSWSASLSEDGDVCCVSYRGNRTFNYTGMRKASVRPALSPSEASKISPNETRVLSGIRVAKYGEYPQTVADYKTSNKLEKLFKSKKLNTTGKNYTFDSVYLRYYDTPFKAIAYPEYEMDGKRYIRVPGRPADDYSKLSTGKQVEEGKPYWVQVQPIEWLMDPSGWWVSRKSLFAGIQFDTKRKYDGNFEKTFMKYYLDTCFAEEMQKDGRAMKTWETVNWEKDSEEKILQKIADFYHAGVDFNKFVWFLGRGATPLMWAAEFCSAKVLDLLIGGGADPSLTDKDGDTILRHAVKNVGPENVKYLIEHGPRNLVNKKNPDGYTALHFAAMFGHMQSVEVLIEGGADASIKNKDGKTALDLARSPDIVEYLKTCMKNSLQQTLSGASQKPKKMSLLKDTKTR